MLRYLSRRWLPLSLVAAVFLGFLCGAIFLLLIDLPQVESLQNFQPHGATIITDFQGRTIGELFHERRLAVPLEQMPLKLRQAVMAIEDNRFLEHHGLSWRGIGRALWRNFKGQGVREGGSTITQQLTKVLFLTPERSVQRKLKEALLALQIERHYSKEEILELYLNQIYFGEGNYGVQAAAQYYFCKEVGALTLAESAALAALPKNPSLYVPARHPEESAKRRTLVLQAMARNNFINNDELTTALAENISAIPCPSTGSRSHLAAMVLSQLEEALGENRVFQGRLTVHTGIDADLQKAAEAAIANFAKQQQGRKLEAALVALAPRSGEIRALVGGTDYLKSQYNRVVQARRQPGSAFKPLIYLAALQAGATQASLYQDAPVRYPNGDGTFYQPKNYHEHYLGSVTLRQSLALSLNSVATQLAASVGINSVIDLARRLGISSPLPANLTMALGSAAVTPLELTGVYASFAAEGLYTTPHLINEVVDDNQETVWENPRVTNQAISPELAWVMRDMLRGVVLSGTATPAKELPCAVAGKTGTTDNSTDVWFEGMLPNLAMGVWAGYDDNRPLGSDTGRSSALPLWIEVANFACGIVDYNSLPSMRPANVVEVPIDLSSGKLATPSCNDPVSAAFIKGTEPRQYCTEEL